MKWDVNLGMFLSNLVMYFVILTAGTVLFNNGVGEIKTVEEAAEALKPIAGEFAYVVFSVGILGLGFLAIPILAACIGHIFAETFEWKRGLDQKWYKAKPFYGVVILSLLIALLINAFGIDPIQSLVVTAIVYGMMAPIAIALILHICNSKKIMGKRTNSLLMNIAGGICLLLTGAAAAALLVNI